ncbi:MAG: serine hydrolase domain-containing protein [Caldilineaceae bacterium]
MQTLTRRAFLKGSTFTVGAALVMAACKPITKPESAATGSAEVDNALRADIEKLAEAKMKDLHVPGMAVGIVQEQKLVYSQGFGVMNVDTHQAVTPQTVFSMASVSKAFAGVAIMQLVEAGKLNIDEPMTAYVPYFRLADERYKAIKIRHLLAHTSGLPALDDKDFFAEWDTPEYDEGAAERYVRSLSTLKLASTPGETFSYSDMGYDIMADLIAKVSGEIFENYIQKHIFTPLGMKHSTFLVKEVAPAQLSASHILDKTGQKVIVNPQFPYDRKHAPSSCLHSNVEDMSRWIIAHLNGGELDGQRMLNAASHQTLWTMLAKTGYGDIFQGYGWGWFFGEMDGQQTVSSIGAQPGVQTTAGLIVPEKAQAVIALGNYLNSSQESFYTVEFAGEATKKLLNRKA